MFPPLVSPRGRETGVDRAALHTLSAFVPLHKNRSLVILKQLDSEASTQLPSGDSYLPLGARSGLKGRSFKIKWDPLVRGVPGTTSIDLPLSRDSRGGQSGTSQGTSRKVSSWPRGVTPPRFPARELGQALGARGTRPSRPCEASCLRGGSRPSHSVQVLAGFA